MKGGDIMHEALFPPEVTGHVPRITLTGHEHLHIEQHQGLIDYEQECIVLRTSCGLLRIAGVGMVFRLYTSDEARITGRIDCVEFQHQEARR